MTSTATRVRVAIRVRPLSTKQQDCSNTAEAVTCIADNSIEISDSRKRRFTFDKVFGPQSTQIQVYKQCVKQLVNGCFQGYNASLVAYGQTGSGKTHTMGTSNMYSAKGDDMGMLPRVINQIFEEVAIRKSAVFHIKAAFLEIYNEEIIDLLTNQMPSRLTKTKNSPYIIENDGIITIVGLTQIDVYSPNQLFSLLEKGAAMRSTAKTNMNDTSSRSHAIFTITIKQDLINQQEKKEKIEQGFMTAKFHFVDLAGSERIKKTGAEGSILKEGININMGLLCLGNVINALTTQDKKNNFVPYRDSKLTRILQDSLGACVSPASCNIEQTSCTLIYAARAMNIKNTPVVNRDPISALKQKLVEMQAQNQNLKLLLKQAGIAVQEQETKPMVAQSVEERTELHTLKTANCQFIKKIEEQESNSLADKKRINELQIEMLEAKRTRDILQLQLEEVLKKYPHMVFDTADRTSLLERYLHNIEQLKAQIKDKDRLNLRMQAECETMLRAVKEDEELLIAKTKEIYKLKKQIVDLVLKRDAQIQSHQTKSQEVDEETLEEDGIYKSKQVEFAGHVEVTNKQIGNMDTIIMQREKQLKEITNNQIDLEYKLISEMKEEYHNKIRMLEKEKEKLEKEILIGKNKQEKSMNLAERDRAVNSKTKKQMLEQQLRDYRKKEKEQSNLEKEVQTKKSKIEGLMNEIKTFKSQRQELNKKLKEDRDIFERFKQDRIKQILELKRKDNQKNNFIKKLENEGRKNIQVIFKKDEETKRLKRANQVLKQILQPKLKPSFKRTTASTIINSSSSINYSNIVDHIITRITCDIDSEVELAKYQKQIEMIEADINRFVHKQSKDKIELERLQLQSKHYGQDNEFQLQQHRKRIDQVSIIIQGLQQNLNFNQSKYNQLLVREANKFQLDSELLYNKSYDSIQVMRKFLKSFIDKLICLLREQIKLKDANRQLFHQNEQLKVAIQELQQQSTLNNQYYQESLTKLREEMMLRTDINNEEDSEMPQLIQKPSNREDTKFDKKYYDRKINDLTKKNKQLSIELDQTKRKCDVVFQKYQDIKKIGNKDKFIGRTSKEQDDLKIQTHKQKRLQRSTTMFASFSHNNAALEEVTSLLHNISFSASNHSLKHYQQEEDVKLENSNLEEELKWECLAKLEGHNSHILSLATQGNILVSSSTKTIKRWDLETNKLISDLTSQHLNGFIKSVVIDKQRNVLLVACEKTVSLWDMRSLQLINVYKGHKDEVRVLHVHKDLFYSGGKGSTTSGSIFVWDFRSNNFIEETEKSQDVFSLISHKNILYYGSRNHQVRRIDMDSLEVLSAFDPPHFDMVTSMTILNNNLISGSKDKNLKLWSLNSAVKNLKNTSYAHNDYVNTLKADPNMNLFYSGSRNGEVKVGKIQKDKIEFIGGINCHDQSVNTLCVLDESLDMRFATGSSDKIVKIWRPTKQSLVDIKNDTDLYFN